MSVRREITNLPNSQPYVFETSSSASDTSATPTPAPFSLHTRETVLLGCTSLPASS